MLFSTGNGFPCANFLWRLVSYGTFHTKYNSPQELLMELITSYGTIAACTTLRVYTLYLYYPYT